MKRHIPFIVLFAAALIFTFFWETSIRPQLLKSNSSTFYLVESFPNFLAVVLMTFGGMALLALKKNIKVIKLAGSIASGGILYEFCQIFIPERTFDVKDIVASVLGGLFSYLIIIFINSKTTK